MMTLKYPEPTVRLQAVPSQGPGLFTLPPQGAATISQTDAQALRTLCDALRERLLGRVVLTATRTVSGAGPAWRCIWKVVWGNLSISW
ncbi:Uncharacterised protein [Klebsiella pneumoniae]|uniref:Uncharacterized protein n=1 Tax=Klebsiella pneumoniae subsp. ozaenae TaxID=574 RepID=A0A377Z3R8_KLEPO|nr:Uncharacterised protein [Klebsiella pneumoniae]STS72106.1 Uncharacterised protein [Klebsiella pneumoniae]STU60008.1 Uncharacterised protein [Klebsiella pneumoniae subsp. ozaenae]